MFCDRLNRKCQIMDLRRIQMSLSTVILKTKDERLMTKKFPLLLFSAFILITTLISCTPSKSSLSVEEFKKPAKVYRPLALWTWMMDYQKGRKQADIVHPPDHQRTWKENLVYFNSRNPEGARGDVFPDCLHGTALFRFKNH